jgi:PAS domain S-box-containing protein
MATILIVDDRAINREFMKTLLSYRGHTIVEANNGQQGLDLAKAWSPQLIISDVLMPAMDGFEFARQVRQLPTIGATPIIFSSAHYPRAESRALAAACGVYTILTKPCEPQVILDAVEEALGNSLPDQEVPKPDDKFDHEHLRLVTDKLSRRNDELRTANLRVTKLIQLGQQIIQEKEPAHLIREYCEGAREIIGAKCAGLGVWNEEDLSIKEFCASGIDSELEAHCVSSLRSEGIIAEILQQRAARRLHAPAGESLTLGFPPAFPPVSSFIGVPIVSATRTYGFLYLAEKLGSDQFNQRDEELLNLLAAQLGVSYENARLYREATLRGDELEKEVKERRRAEGALRKKEAQFDSLLHSSIIGILVTEVDGRINQANDAYLEMTGYTREDLTTGRMRWDELTPPEYLDVSRRAVEQLLQSGVVPPFEKEYIRKDGSRLPVLVGVNLLAGSKKECVTFVLDITERKRADALRAYLASIVEFSDDAIIGKTLEGVITSWNAGAEKIYGYRAAEVVGRNVTMLAPADMVGEIHKILKQINEGVSVRDDSTVRVRKDGQFINVTLSVSPIKDRAGNIIGSSTIARDITASKRTEEKLSLLATAVEQSGNTILITDAEGTIQYVNPAFEQTCGYSREEVLGQNPRILKSGQITRESYKKLWDTITSGAQWSGSFTNRKKDGTLYEEEATISPVRNSAGKIMNYVAVKQDVTERKIAEEEKARLLAQVQDQKQRIDSIVTNVPGVVWEAWGQPDESSQRIDFVSDYVEKMLGYTVEQWLSTPNYWLSIVHPDDKERAAREAASIYVGGTGGVTMFRWMTSDGRALWTESHIMVVCDQAGNPTGMRGVTLDVTERKRAEEEIISAHTLALETAQVKAEFLSNMSHELRTPMNGIIGFTGLMLETDLSDEQREYLDLVSKSADLLMILINNILTFSESDPDKLESVEFSLQEHVHESVMTLAGAAKDKGLRLSYQISPEAPATLTGDPGRLSKILRLLIDNAVKFTERGDIDVRVSLRSRTTGEIGLQFTVQDTGIGVPADRQEMIFNPFIQADGSTSRRYGGAGLGLAICRHMVEMVGDRIWVESEPGCGSSFHFTARFKVSQQSEE